VSRSLERNQSIQTGKTSGPVSIAQSELMNPSVPQPTLGLLAQGSRGLSIWRRPEEQES